MNTEQIVSRILLALPRDNVCLCKNTKTLEEAIELKNAFNPSHYGCKQFRLQPCYNHGRGAILVRIFGTERYTKDTFGIQRTDCIDDNQPLITAQELEYEKEYNDNSIKVCKEFYEYQITWRKLNP